MSTLDGARALERRVEELPPPPPPPPREREEVNVGRLGLSPALAVALGRLRGLSRCVELEPEGISMCWSCVEEETCCGSTPHLLLQSLRAARRPCSSGRVFAPHRAAFEAPRHVL